MVLLASVMMGISSVGLEAVLFHDRFGYTLSTTDYSMNQRTLANWGGITLFLVMESSMSTALTQVLQIPQMRPVHNREYGSGLYSLSAYYMGIFIISTLIMSIQPIITASGGYYILDPYNTDFENFMKFNAANLLMHFWGSAFGIMCSAMFESDEAAVLVLVNIYQITLVGSGIVANLNHCNWFLEAFSSICAIRYGVEIQLRNTLDENPSRQQALDFYDYDAGETLCYTIPVAISAGMLLVGYFFLWMQSRAL